MLSLGAYAEELRARRRTGAGVAATLHSTGPTAKALTKQRAAAPSLQRVTAPSLQRAAAPGTYSSESALEMLPVSVDINKRGHQMWTNVDIDW